MADQVSKKIDEIYSKWTCGTQSDGEVQSDRWE